jgi:hypothetical protein
MACFCKRDEDASAARTIETMTDLDTIQWNVLTFSSNHDHMDFALSPEVENVPELLCALLSRTLSVVVQLSSLVQTNAK